MGNIAEVSNESAAALWKEIAPKLEDAASLDNAAQRFLDAVYEKFGVDLALSRVFVTLPYNQLPPEKRDWVSNLANDKGVGGILYDDTPVLTLIGTRGQEMAWNNVQKSQGHVGIPLVSPKFVDAIPMVARLLSDLGVGDDLGQLSTSGLDVDHRGSTDTFYVEDASTSVDAQSRHIIPMQDFVGQYDVRTVFGVGGPYGAGHSNIVVCIFFTKEALPKETARLFEPLVEQFKNATTEFVKSGNIFA